MFGRVARKFGHHDVQHAEAAVHEDMSQMPPQYDAGQATDLMDGFDDLPVHVDHAEAARSEHTFFKRHGGSSCLTLKVKSGAGAPTSRPLLFEGVAIEGCVQLVLTAAQAVQSVTIELGGRTHIARPKMEAELKEFLKLPLVVWKSEAAGQKLQPGTYDWPFIMQLPRTTTIPWGGKQVTVPLPPAYSATGSLGTIEYDLHVVVRRAALREDDHLSTPVNYLPQTRPRQASRLRQLAYANGTGLVGPDGDPEGWLSMPGKIHGTFFGKLDVEVECTISLAKPLVYARDTAIPFMIDFSGQATQALDLFAQPSSVSAYLERTVIISQQVTHTTVGIGRCFSPTGHSMPESRRLEGEIPVARDLKTSFALDEFALSYSFHLIVDAVGFVPAGKSSHALELMHTVAVATDRPRGPRQRIVVPHNEETTPHNTQKIGRSTLLI